MNITTEISKEIGQPFEKIINDNVEIQIYINITTGKFQWRDSRFEETCDVWTNSAHDEESELVKALKSHLESKTK